jgi:hypothetical protein
MGQGACEVIKMFLRWAQQEAHGTPHFDLATWRARKLAPLLSALLQETNQTASGCLEWTGRVDKDGYGRSSEEGFDYMAHRRIYQLTNGSIPIELELDHKCRNRLCVNVVHLEPVPKGTNLARRKMPRADHCPSGHEYTTDNTYVDPKGFPHCRLCNKASQARRRKKAKDGDAP